MAVPRKYKCLNCGKEITDADKAEICRKHGVDVCAECFTPTRKENLSKRKMQYQEACLARKAKQEALVKKAKQDPLDIKSKQGFEADKFLALEACGDPKDAEEAEYVYAEYVYTPCVTRETRKRRNQALFDKELRDIDEELEL